MTAEDVVGLVLGRRVRCLTPEAQMLCHTGYPPHLGSYDDVWALTDGSASRCRTSTAALASRTGSEKRRSDVGTYEGATTFSTRS